VILTLTCRALICKFLGAFAILRKTSVGFILSSRLSPHGRNRFPLTDFYEIWYLMIFRISVEKIRVCLNSDRNEGYYTRRHVSWIKPPRWTAGNRFFLLPEHREGTYLCLTDSVLCVTATVHILPSLVNFQSNARLHRTTDPVSV
jgi:hypothetical protein